jgi:hypothetical protein
MAATLGNGDYTFGDATTISTAGILSSAASGYHKLPNGIIMQWGTGTTTSVPAASAATQTVTFPTTFTTVYQVILTCLEASGTGTNAAATIHLSSKTTSNFVARFVQPSAGSAACTLTPKYVAFGV